MPSRSLRSDEELHDLDLVAEVEVDGRLVEDEDRRVLRDRHGQEDELALAEAQLARVAAEEVADPDAVDRRGDGGAVGGTEAADRVLVGQATERHDLLDGRRERQRGQLGHDGEAAGDGRVGRGVASGAPASSTVPAAGSTRPAMARRSVDLPAPFGPTRAIRSPGAIAQVDVAERGPAAIRDGQALGANGGGHSS